MACPWFGVMCPGKQGLSKAGFVSVEVSSEFDPREQDNTVPAQLGLQKGITPSRKDVVLPLCLIAPEKHLEFTSQFQSHQRMK